MTDQQLQSRVAQLENQLHNLQQTIKGAISADARQKDRLQVPADSITSFQICLCVSTEDPLLQGGIRIFHPLYDNTDPPPTVDQLQLAYPITPFGGIDDSGAFWVPPAGSKVAVIYKDGNYNDPYYLGTIWDRHRGKDGQHVSYQYDYPYMDEYNCLYEGRRGGYNFVPNDGDQVMPPCNTDSYNSYDWDDHNNFNLNFDDTANKTFPNYYMVKTPGKHYWKFVDGNHKCNKKGRRVEVSSGRGNVIIMKDDHLHPFGQFSYTTNFPDLSCANEYPCCDDGMTPQPMIQFDNLGCVIKSTADCEVLPDTGCDTSNKTTAFELGDNTPANPFHKRKEELRFYRGNGWANANFVDLPQSGMAFQSLSGQQLIFDDSVDQPMGVPDWDLDFNFGCNNLFLGGAKLKSATGHSITLSDKEEAPEVRGEENGIFITTAFGNFINLCDHTVPVGDSCESPPNFAGEKRGISMGTASNLFVMSDAGLKRSGESARTSSPISTTAEEGGYEGYVLLRSGYGIELLFSDKDIQSETKNQYLRLSTPQTTNVARGPHFLTMQDQAEGPGFVFLRAGGIVHISSYDESLEVVGDEDTNPASKFVSVTENYLVDVKEFYFNHAKFHCLMSDQYMFLIAGQDCEIPDDATIADTQNDSLSAIKSTIESPGTDVSSTVPRKGPCIHSSLTDKHPWACPHTGFIHYGVYPDPSGETDENGDPVLLLDSRSNRVFVSSS